MQIGRDRAGFPLYPRTWVRGVACSACGAGVGQMCIGARGQARVSNHLERVKAYHEAVR